MMKKSIIAILAIVAAVGLVFAAYGDTGKSDTTNSNELQKQQNNDNPSNSNTNISTTTEISASKAQEIAQKYIEEPNAKAGTPKLTTFDGKKIYVVPIIDNGETVGEIEIDAQTGANLGGAGGVQ